MTTVDKIMNIVEDIHMTLAAFPQYVFSNATFAHGGNMAGGNLLVSHHDDHDV